MTVTADTSQTAADAELARAVAAGDSEAFERLYEQHHKRVFSLCLRMLGSVPQAEDLTQEIFLKVYRTLSSYRPDSGALVTWMVRVGRNHLIDHYRKFKTERTHTDSLEVEYEKAEENPTRYASPEQALEKLELSERVHQALLRVSEDLREAVVLRDLEEFTYEEIADMLKLPLGTVKLRINRGRAELARILGKMPR